MAEQWFLVPSTGTGEITDGIRPKYKESVNVHVGRHIESQDKFVVRFYADQQTLDSLAAKDDTRTISDQEMRDTLNELLNRDYTIEQWNDKFRTNITNE